MRNIRSDFPILKRKVHGKSLVYLDNAATTQKPRQVIDSMTNYYETMNANVHRGIHTLSEEATAAYEGVREKIAKFIGAADPSEIIFVRNTTEAINLVARSFVQSEILNHKSEILLSEMEHHSNIVPWQILISQTLSSPRTRGSSNDYDVDSRVRGNDGVLRYIPVKKNGTLDYSNLDSLITKKTAIVSVTHASNVLGTINDIPRIVKAAHAKGVPVLVDGAQSVGHIPVNVQKLGCDFFAFSGHKMFGPTGIGVLWAKRELLEKMQPFLGGGDMIKRVSYTDFESNDLPWKFEAGTPNIAGVIGLGAAVDYIQSIGMREVQKYEINLTQYALREMRKIPGMNIYEPTVMSSPRKRGSTTWIPGQARDDGGRVGLISFNLAGIHPHDLATLLDEEGIAIRAGHMCAQPLVEKLGEKAIARVSFSIYNTKREIDQLVSDIRKIQTFFGV